MLNTLSPATFLVWYGEWPAGRIEPNRRLYDYELVYVSGGRGYIAIDGAGYHCEPGSLLVIPPGMVHFTRAETRIQRWCIHFDWYGECRAQKELTLPYWFSDDPEPYREELMAAAPPPGLGFSPPCHIRLDAESRGPFLSLLREFFAAPPDSAAAALRRRGMLWEILSFTLGVSAPAPPPRSVNTLFFQAKNLLDREFRNPSLRVESVAHFLCITPNHLLKLFRRETGMSTQDYLFFRRMQCAGELLNSTRLSIAEIAERCGFPDANYFARRFRRRFGCTPREFRSRAGMELSAASGSGRA